MKCQILFSGKKYENISKCRLLKILPRVLSVKTGVYFTLLNRYWSKVFFVVYQLHAIKYIIAITIFNP